MYRCHELSKSCMLVNPNLYKPPLQYYKTPDLFSLSRIFTDLIMHNYRSNQSALMTRCGTDFRHQYGIFGGESQTSVSRNATRPGAKKDGCFRRLSLNLFSLLFPGVWVFVIPKTQAPRFFEVASHPKCDHFWEKNILQWQDRPYSYLCFKKEISKKYCFFKKLWTK